MTTGKAIALTRQTFVGKVMSLRWCMSMAEWSYPMPKVRGSCWEELPHIQGKEQWLHFAGAAMKRYPTLKVRGNQVRQ